MSRPIDWPSSTIGRYFLWAYKITLVLWSAIWLKLEESRWAESPIVMISHCCSSVVTEEVVLLVIARSHCVPNSWVWIVTDSLENHVISFLNSAESDVFKSLHEWKSSPVSFLGFLLKVHIEGTFVIDIVTCPEVHAENPRNCKFWKSTPNHGHLLEKSRSSLIVEVSVAEHWGMGIHITKTSCSASGTTPKCSTTNLQHSTNEVLDNLWQSLTGQRSSFSN